MSNVQITIEGEKQSQWNVGVWIEILFALTSDFIHFKFTGQFVLNIV